MLHGLMMTAKLRGTKPSYALLQIVPVEVRAELEERGTQRESQHLVLPQFRIRPNQTEIDASWVARAVRDLPDFADDRGRLLRHWIYHAVAWTANGI